MRLIPAFAASAILVAGVVPAYATDTTPRAADYCSVDVSTRVLVCADSAAGLASVRAATPHARLSQVLIARLYDAANYDTSAGYLNVYAASGCTSSGADVDASLSNLGAWSDRVSSFSSYGTCATRLWANTGFSGAAYPSSTGWLVDGTSLGALNNAASSVQFS
jgi:hypothetical protein